MFEGNRPLHKLLCTTYENFKDDKRPSDNHVRAILFPADGTRIKHLWLEQIRAADGVLYPKLKPHLEDIAASDLFDPNRLEYDDIHNQKKFPGFEVGHGLMIIGRTIFAPHPDLPINKSIMALGKVGQMKTRTGNHFVVARKLVPASKTNDHQTTILADVNFRDFRHALDYYQLHPTNLCVVNPERFKGPTMPGLIIHCDGAFKRLFRLGLTEQVQQVLIPRKSLANSIQMGMCVKHFKMDLRWYFRRLPVLYDWDKAVLENSLNGLRSNEARHLVTYSADHPDGELQVPEIHTGTLVLFDEGGAPIQPAHLIFTNKFIDSLAKQGTSRGPDTNQMKGFTMLLLDKAGVHYKMALEEFWAKMKKDSQAQGVNIDRLPSPYELQSTLDEAGRAEVAAQLRIEAGRDENKSLPILVSGLSRS
jgi:hypothetical protein